MSAVLSYPIIPQLSDEMWKQGQGLWFLNRQNPVGAKREEISHFCLMNRILQL